MTLGGVVPDVFETLVVEPRSVQPNKYITDRREIYKILIIVVSPFTKTKQDNITLCNYLANEIKDAILCNDQKILPDLQPILDGFSDSFHLSKATQKAIRSICYCIFLSSKVGEIE